MSKDFYFMLFLKKAQPPRYIPSPPPKKQNRLLPSHFLFSYSSFVFDVWMHIEWLWDELRDPSCMLNLLLYKRCHSKKKKKNKQNNKWKDKETKKKTKTKNESKLSSVRLQSDRLVSCIAFHFFCYFPLFFSVISI